MTLTHTAIIKLKAVLCCSVNSWAQKHLPLYLTMHFKIMNFSITNKGNYWIVVTTEFKIQNWCALVHMHH